jgi:hypothetical protein
MKHKIVTSFDGNRFYPYALIKQTDKTATVQKCTSDGDLQGEPITKRISYVNGLDKPTVALNIFEDVYISQVYQAA